MTLAENYEFENSSRPVALHPINNGIARINDLTEYNEVHLSDGWKQSKY